MYINFFFKTSVIFRALVFFFLIYSLVLRENVNSWFLLVLSIYPFVWSFMCHFFIISRYIFRASIAILSLFIIRRYIFRALIARHANWILIKNYLYKDLIFSELCEVLISRTLSVMMQGQGEQLDKFLHWLFHCFVFGPWLLVIIIDVWVCFLQRNLSN